MRTGPQQTAQAPGAMLGINRPGATLHLVETILVHSPTVGKTPRRGGETSCRQSIAATH